MSTENKVLSPDDFMAVPSGKGLKVGIVVAEWNKKITHKLLYSAIERLKKCEVEDIKVMSVPGAFELINGAARMLGGEDVLDGVIVIGAVIRGGTPHFDYICQGVTFGISHLNVKYPQTPTVFCVLTTDNIADAEDRAGGKLGNKGEEAADTLLKTCRPYYL